MYRTPSFGSVRDRGSTNQSGYREANEYYYRDNAPLSNLPRYDDSKVRTGQTGSRVERGGSASRMRDNTSGSTSGLEIKVERGGSVSRIRDSNLSSSSSSGLDRSSSGVSKSYIPLTQRNSSGVSSYQMRGPSRTALRSASSTSSVEEVTSPGAPNNDLSSNRREAREAFLRGEQVSNKYDPSSGSSGGERGGGMARTREKDSYERERENAKEKMAMMSNGGGRPMAGLSSQPKSTKEIDGYVGFANLPNQVYRKSVKKGFEFTLMVVGESGQGKSTLINSMFLSDLYSSEYPGPSQRIKKTVKVETTQVVLREGGVQLRLRVVDTPGFGDAVDNSNCWQPIIEHIEAKYDEYLNAESQVNRQVKPDQRVHCCLYFISPNGHGLKPLDVEFMRRLHDKVNIIPLIAKADTMTPDECREFKKTILNEIAQHKIKIYEFPDCEDEEEAKIQKKLKDRVPFAVVGSNTVVDAGGKKVRGRVYPWGVVEVENLEHNDFIALRNMLIRTHMQDLKDVTNNVHYENFRYNKLSSVTQGDGTGARKNQGGKSPLLQMEEEKKEHVMKMKKMEAEMEQVFELKVKEKMQKLKDSEADLQKRAEQMRKRLEQQEREMEDKLEAFRKEQAHWEGQEEERRRSHETLKKEKKKGLF